MAHVRKDTLVRTLSWSKHMKPDGKQEQAARERRACSRDIDQQWQDYENSLWEEDKTNNHGGN